jgi:hypothetical protein
MRKLRLAFLLPTIQVLFAASLLQWAQRRPVPRGGELYVPTARLICFGLNAPALIFRFLNPIRWGSSFAWVPRATLGFDTDDIFFLVGVIVVWYLTGRALDQRQQPWRTAEGNRTSVRKILLYSILLAAGGALLVLGLQELGAHRANNPASSVEGILTLTWSIALIFSSSYLLFRRAKHPV